MQAANDGVFTIQTATGRKVERGKLVSGGLFGVHRAHKHGWEITHLPTGMRTVCLPEEREAICVARWVTERAAELPDVERAPLWSKEPGPALVMLFERHLKEVRNADA